LHKGNKGEPYKEPFRIILFALPPEIPTLAGIGNEVAEYLTYTYARCYFCFDSFLSQTELKIIKMKTAHKVIYWLPRIICIAAISFISRLAADAFRIESYNMAAAWAFLMHLIPSFILLGILIIAWKWEMIGGIIFMLIGLGFTPLIYSHNYHMNHSVWISLGIIALITFPFIVVGALFLVSNWLKNRRFSIS
jgi:ABC-type multidrug transport system fused ATPase/permease subunit